MDDFSLRFCALTGFRRPIALLKMYVTRSAQETATDAVQVFGGRGITKTGMGSHIEHVYLSPFYLPNAAHWINSITVWFHSILFSAEVCLYSPNQTRGDCCLRLVFSGGCARRSWCKAGYAKYAEEYEIVMWGFRIPVCAITPCTVLPG